MTLSFCDCLTAVAGGQSRPSRHPLGRNDQDPTAHLHYQLAQIVEQVIDLRVAQISVFDPTRLVVEPADYLAVGLNQQRGYLPGGRRLGNLRQVVTAEPSGFCHGEPIGQYGEGARPASATCSRSAPVDVTQF